MSRPLKRGILGASTIILSKDIDKYALGVVQIFMKQTLFKFSLHKRKINAETI